MTDKPFDPWELSSGLPDDFNGAVQDAFFGTDAEYNDGKTVILKLEVLSDDPEIGEAGVTTLMFPCGAGWEARDGGKGIAREDGKQKKFNAQSGIGLLVKHAIEAGAGDVLREKGNPMTAGIWVGMNFHWKRKEFSFKNGGEVQEYSRTLPDAFLGSSGVGGVVAAPAGAPTAVSGAVAATATTTTTTTPSTNGTSAVNGVLKAKLKVLARDVKTKGQTHDQFIERAFGEVDGVNGDSAAEDAVMAYGPDSIWESVAVG